MPIKGQIVVRTGNIGPMRKMGQLYQCRTTQECADYGLGTILIGNFRLATELETKMYHLGARTLDDIATMITPITEEDILNQIDF